MEKYLDGAGVDIIAQPFWGNALTRQDYSWVVMPVGRTEWVNSAFRGYVTP